MREHELTGKMVHIATNFLNGKPMVTFELNEEFFARDMINDLNGCEKLIISVDKYREKRSLNANAYAWVLITKIANAIRSSKEEVYLRMLKEYGQSDMISVLADIPIDRFIKYYEEAGESTLNGKLFKHYRVYTGSSEFDTKEMSIFIDGIVSEAKELNIQTMTPNELDRLKSLWSE